MKNYVVTVKVDLNIQAESQEDAVKKAADKVLNSPFPWDISVPLEVTYEAKEKIATKELTFAELESLFHRVNEKKIAPATGYIVFTESSFDKFYTENSRTYSFSSDNKAFQSEMGGYSIFASCQDGTDPNLRLDLYMRGEYGAWKIEKCYMEKGDYERVINLLA